LIGESLEVHEHHRFVNLVAEIIPPPAEGAPPIPLKVVSTRPDLVAPHGSSERMVTAANARSVMFKLELVGAADDPAGQYVPNDDDHSGSSNESKLPKMIQVAVHGPEQLGRYYKIASRPVQVFTFATPSEYLLLFYLFIFHDRFF
jgi:hypothetical protein